MWVDTVTYPILSPILIAVTKLTAYLLLDTRYVHKLQASSLNEQARRITKLLPKP